MRARERMAMGNARGDFYCWHSARTELEDTLLSVLTCAWCLGSSN